MPTPSSTLLPPKPALPHPVSLIYTIYRHGERLSEAEALERTQDATKCLQSPPPAVSA